MEVAARQDLQFDLSAVVHDRFCAPLDMPPGWLTLCHLPSSDLDAIEAALVADSVLQSDVDTCADGQIEDSSVLLSALTRGSDVIPMLEPGEGIWALSLFTGDLGLVGRIGDQFLAPSETGTVTTVAVADPCGSIELDVDLGEGSGATATPTGPDVLLDWSGVTTGLSGQAVALHSLVELRVGQFASVDELGIGLVRDDLGAEHTWTALDVAASSVSLTGMMSDDGVVFPGFAEGVWAITLRPGDDEELLPTWLTVLQPG